MERSAIYRRTGKGRKALEDRTSGLEKHERRLLTLVDGQRSAAELSVTIRASEFERTLERLIAERWIERVEAGAADSARLARAPLANDPVIFAAIKVRAMTEIQGWLGPAADLLVSEINRCTTPLGLRENLRSLETALVALMGEEEGIALARRIGSELTKLMPKG